MSSFLLGLLIGGSIGGGLCWIASRSFERADSVEREQAAMQLGIQIGEARRLNGYVVDEHENHWGIGA